ncbi:hypothetical protein ACJ73_09661 [Blastomyces percursus]|uniref:AAA+ ATPase domain-containing protein n=1 Tax=Blastomyces percursus TaxID=1658174 RepID=A0A1J9P463_9EURO|nr:hypothetical protein ACJ73_09661 [Blastomyces percursus]
MAVSPASSNEPFLMPVMATLETLFPGYTSLLQLFFSYFCAIIVAAPLTRWSFIKKYLTSTIEIRYDDDAYNYMLYWMQKSLPQASHVVAETKTRKDMAWFGPDNDENDEMEAQENVGLDAYWSQTMNQARSKLPRYTPAAGIHYFRYKGRRLWLERISYAIRPSAPWLLNAENTGNPYRRGYLFYGHPGTGKTSLAFAIASQLRLGIYSLTFKMKSLDDEGLDSAGISRTHTVDESKGRDNPGRVTLSGLLNTIDGIDAKENRILIMTTNYHEKIDKALRRPGRIDKEVPFDLADKTACENLFRAIYSDTSTDDGVRDA